MKETKYDSQIARLTHNPSLIEHDWCAGEGIFEVIGKSYKAGGEEIVSGCLTQIRSDVSPIVHHAIIKGKANNELTKKIRGDERIPKKLAEIKPEHLSVFKEYRILIDRMEAGEAVSLEPIANEKKEELCARTEEASSKEEGEKL